MMLFGLINVGCSALIPAAFVSGLYLHVRWTPQTHIVPA